MNRPQDNLHLYALFGQSNMQGAGRLEEFTEPPNPRIVRLSFEGEPTIAREPLHDWATGETMVVGPGFYFAQHMLADAPDDVSIGLIPNARGGTSLKQWLKPNNPTFDRIVTRCRNACRRGTFKGILWHQGETDSNDETLARSYAERFATFADDFRRDVGIPDLPIVLGKLGRFLEDYFECDYYPIINEQLERITKMVPHTACVESDGAGHIGDLLHFDTHTQKHIMAPRYAAAMKRLLAEQDPA